jgi:uncharacterized protein DUF6748
MKDTAHNLEWRINVMLKSSWVTILLGVVAVATLILAVTVPRQYTARPVSNVGDGFSPSSAPVEPAAATSMYFTIRRDLRRCAAPMCGGYFVRAVNNVRTKCGDGRSASECYVGEIDWNGNGKVEPNRALLRGEIVNEGHRRLKVGRFRVQESWQASSSKTGVGEFYRARDLHINCITHPCMTHHEVRLNSTSERDVAGVQINTAGASDSVLQDAMRAMQNEEGILVRGTHKPDKGPAGRADTLIASQFYLRATADTSLSRPCMITGCSSQVCSDQEVVTTCEYRTEYACYRKAKCERQSNGECGWTQTKELMSCVNGAKKQTGPQIK